MQRGDLFIYGLNGKPRPVLCLGPAPSKNGLLVVGISSKDFGEMGMQISGFGLRRPSWVTPQINVFYNVGLTVPPGAFGRVPEALVSQIEQALLEYVFGNLLEPVDTSISC